MATGVVQELEIHLREHRGPGRKIFQHREPLTGALAAHCDVRVEFQGGRMNLPIVLGRDRNVGGGTFDEALFEIGHLPQCRNSIDQAGRRCAAGDRKLRRPWRHLHQISKCVGGIVCQGARPPMSFDLRLSIQAPGHGGGGRGQLRQTAVEVAQRGRIRFARSVEGPLQLQQILRRLFDQGFEKDPPPSCSRRRTRVDRELADRGFQADRRAASTDGLRDFRCPPTRRTEGTTLRASACRTS